MLKRILAVLFFLCIIVGTCYAAEDFEFGPLMYISDLGCTELVPSETNIENFAFVSGGDSIRAKSKINYNLLQMDFLLKENTDGALIISDTKNREATLLFFTADGNILDADGLALGIYESNNWQNIIVAFDTARQVFVYADGKLLATVSVPQKMLGIYSVYFDGVGACYDNLEMAFMNEPSIVKISNLDAANSLSKVLIEFNAPVVIGGEVTKKHIYCFSEPLESGQNGITQIDDVYDLLNNEINISTVVSAASAPSLYFVNEITQSSLLAEASMKIFNPGNSSVHPTIYVCALSDDTLVGINVYENVDVEPGISWWNFPLDVSGLSGDITLRIFVWQDEINPYQKDSLVGIFETTFNLER